MRVALALFVLLAPHASAGSASDPELTDAQGDVWRWPGVPIQDDNVDMLAVWYEEADQVLLVHMKLAAYAPVTNVPNVLANPSFAVNFFVDGEGPHTPCSGWGAFEVRSNFSGSQRTGNLGLSKPYDPAKSGCDADWHDLQVSVAGTTVTWSVPESLVPRLHPGAELTAAGGVAWSGSTWPASPSDWADKAPGRPFILAPSNSSAAPPATTTRSSTTTAPSSPSSTTPSSSSPTSAIPSTTASPSAAASTTTAPAAARSTPPLAAAVLGIALLAVAGRRRLP